MAPQFNGDQRRAAVIERDVEQAPDAGVDASQQHRAIGTVDQAAVDRAHRGCERGVGTHRGVGGRDVAQPSASPGRVVSGVAGGRVLGLADPDGGLAGRVRIAAAGFAGRPPPVPEGVLGAVTEALAQRRVLAVVYAARGRATGRDLRLCPQALVHRGPSMTLVALDEGSAGVGPPKSYVLHRMSSATVLADEPAAASPGFDLDRFVPDGGLAPRHGDSPTS